MTSDKVMAGFRGAGRVVSAIVIAYFFLLTLMVATAQQKVVATLVKDNVGYDYSVAIRYYFGNQNLIALRTKNSSAIKQATSAQRKAADALSDAQRTLAAEAADLQQDLQNLAGRGCPGAQVTVQTPPDPGALLTAAAATQHCGASGVDPVQKGIANEVNEGADSVRRTLDEIAGYNRDSEDQADQLKLLHDERQSLASEFESAGKAASSIAILRVFEESWWPGATQLVYLPPSLMAIALAFSSGLFGALLITLVLFVYPENQFKFTRSASYGGRILLGGLIALGVFVLLFSGVAVLGGVEGSNTQNLMAYAAIGILSGMFSDRAAGWLSEQSGFSSPRTDPPTDPG